MDQHGDAMQGLSGGDLPLARASAGRPLLVALLLAAAFFGVYLVNIGIQDFTNASENVVIEAALEAREGGPWWIPNMHGRPRILKPPLATWIAAAGMRPATIASTRSGDLSAREAAFRELAREARWPSALAAALVVLGTWWLGRILADDVVGLAAAAMCGSTVLLLRFGRMANTDVQLTLWVVLANGFLAMAMLRGKWWSGCLGAGACLGLAMMSKGPVSLLQSVLPWGAFAVYRKVVQGDDAIKVQNEVNLLAMGAGVVALLAIALPWPVSVVMLVPDAAQSWWKDVFAPPGTEERVGHWWGYINLVPNLLPWAPLFIGGLCLPFLKRFRQKRVIAAWFLFAAPIVVMSFVRDKNERYGMPMVPAAAILSGVIAVEFARNRGRLIWSDRLAEVTLWVAGFAMAAAILAAAIPIGKQPALLPWNVAWVGSALAMAAMVIALLGRWRGIWWAMVAGPAVVSLMVYHIAMLGYVASASGQSDFKPIALHVAMKYPDAELLYYEGGTGRHVPTDLAIYAGRIVRSGSEEMLQRKSDGKQVLFALQRADQPVREYPGWVFAASEPAEGRRCCVYTKEPSQVP